MIRPMWDNRLFKIFAILFVVSFYFIFSLENGLGDYVYLPTYADTVTSVNECTDHHIVIVLGGYKTINLASVLFKSLLFHQRGPLVFHFITDMRARKVLPTLFDTWNLPSVRYHIYDMEPFKKEVDWVPNSHYSSVFGLIRLAIPEILPDYVKQVLFLDTDLVVLDDITPIFDSFKGTNDSALYAMGENLSPWFTQKGHWPARGRGYNAGVVLMHIERMRKANWSEMWKRETRKRLETFRGGNDQDILNVLILAYPDIVVEFPCEYNFQMGGQGQPERCRKVDRIKIAHFNSPQKLKLKSKYVVHFAQYHAIYQSMDGYVLRLRDVCESDNSTVTVLADLTEKEIECKKLLTAIQTKYRTHLYVNGIAPSNVSGDVTLITHLTVDRFEMFGELLDAWKGPVSAAIYCTDAELSQFEKFLSTSRIGRGRKNVAMHAIFKTGNYYPSNYLRNVALNASDADFVFIADVDFIPSKGLYESLRAAMKEKRDKKVLVVPAFEMLSTKTHLIPRSKADLLSKWDDGQIQPFGKDEWLSNNSTTIYDDWKHADSSLEMNWTSEYEFSAVMARTDTHLFEERLIGLGWHNISLLATLQTKGYQFILVPSGFVVHHHHSSSFEISRNTGSALYRKCMKMLETHFVSDPSFLTLAERVSATSP